MEAEVKDSCPECKGMKWKIIEDKARPCLCLQREMLEGFLNTSNADLAGARQIRRGPLYAVDVQAGVTLDRTKDNLLIKAPWLALRPHLRLALGYRHYLDPGFRFSLVTDERVLNVYVGNEQYRSRKLKVRDDVDSFNGLRDLVEDPPLVIVRLGFIGHKNVAAAGALKQALMIREVARRPTWIVYDPRYETPVSWGEEVAAYAREHFAVVVIDDESHDESPTMNVEPHVVPAGRPTPPPAAREFSSSGRGDEFGIEGSRKPRSQGYSRKRSSSGGGEFQT